MTCSHEVWKDIPGYEGRYQVSNLGHVRSLDMTVRCKFGKGYRLHKGRQLKPRKINTGYLIAQLSRDGRNSQQLIHRLVASAFIPNPENKPFVNHINGVRTDDFVGNLEWCTYSENERHKHYALGFDTRLQKRPVICLDTGVQYPSIAEAARATSGKTRNICMCCQGKRKRTHGLRWAYAEEVSR